MKTKCFFLLITWLFFSVSIFAQKQQLKPRLVVLTDISSWEHDDRESLTRLMAYADMFEIEGIVVTTGWSMDNVYDVKQFKDTAQDVINAYEKDLPNLLKRSNQSDFTQDDGFQKIGYWPSVGYLSKRLMFGSMRMGMSFIGAANNSDGSNLIIKLADEDDDRPLWVCFWGGGNTLAQAIWQVQQTRSDAELKTFLHRIRAYAITDQDRAQKSSFETSANTWMRRNFASELLFIWDECAWGYQLGTGKNKWSEYAANIQNHGNLGHQYPKYSYGVEGDTPSFLHLMSNGLNNPDVPTQAGWGGYFVWGEGEDKKGYSYVNYTGTTYNTCTNYEKYYYQATFNDFAARMDWAKNGTGNRNPIIVLDGDSGINIITKVVKPNSAITLNASSSFDPDNDSLSFKWWVQPEAGSYSGIITIANSNSKTATLNVPANSLGKSFHIICEVTDNGTPNLTSYRRIIFEPGIGTKPTVAITSPINNATLSEQPTITITADATDSDGAITSVEFFQGTISLGIDYLAPYSFSWSNVTSNYYSITAKATDNDGNIIISKPVVINVKNTTDLKIIKYDEFTIYPNPVTNKLSIDLESEFDTLSIFNLDGKLMMEKKYNTLIKTVSMQLNLAKGIYLVKLSNAQTANYSKILVE